MNTDVSDQISVDHELARRIRNGEDAAFTELYSRHKQGVYLYCVRFLGTGPAAEDIFQDVFMKCLEQLRSGREITNIKGYLLSTAHNRCLNVIRDNKHPADIDEMEELLPAPEVGHAERYDLQYALDRLPAQLRQAILLCEYEGYSYEEIAGLTGVPLTTVRKRIFRARQLMRGLLNPKNDH